MFFNIGNIFFPLDLGLGSEEDSDSDSTVDLLLRNKMSNFL